MTPEEQAAADAASAQATADAAAAANAQASKGFPAETPVAEMKVEEQAAYWKFQSRKHEGVANTYKAFGEVDAVKAIVDAAKAAEIAKLNPSEQAVIAAREEGRTAALVEASSSTAIEILKVNLIARGKTTEEAAAITAAFNPAGFVSNGTVETDRIAAFANSIAGPPDATGWPAMGQGSFQRQTGSSVANGRAMYAAQHGKS